MGYPTRYTSLLYLLGALPYPARYWSLYYTPGVLAEVYWEEALGSSLLFLPGWRVTLRRVSPFLWEKSGQLCAEYSGLPYENVKNIG